MCDDMPDAAFRISYGPDFESVIRCTPGLKNGYMSQTQFEAIRTANLESKEKSINEMSPIFYRAQSYQTLGDEIDRVLIKVDLSEVGHSWKKHVLTAVSNINMAAPGLNLCICKENEVARIKVYERLGGGCYAKMPGFWYGGSPKVYLDSDWPEYDRERTATHELLHALGYGHEHQRRDAQNYVCIRVDESDGFYNQYCQIKELEALTRFDPFSVMMYPETRKLLRNNMDDIWKLQQEAVNSEMSELDKVALNLLYRPCKSRTYAPHKSSVTALYYCGREVMKTNNRPVRTNTDGKCGPTHGPICPACRVIESEDVKAFQEKDKWQGWSGNIYCGRTLRSGGYKTASGHHDGFCGPDNGQPCEDCYSCIYPEGYGQKDCKIL